MTLAVCPLTRPARRLLRVNWMRSRVRGGAAVPAAGPCCLSRDLYADERGSVAAITDALSNALAIKSGSVGPLLDGQRGGRDAKEGATSVFSCAAPAPLLKGNFALPAGLDAWRLRPYPRLIMT